MDQRARTRCSYRLPPGCRPGCWPRRGDLALIPTFDEFVHKRQSNLLRLTVPYMVPGTGFTCYSRSMTTLRRLVEGARSTQ